MRLFIAVELDNNMRSAVSKALSALRERACGGRFIPIENAHITLHFIGESNDLAGAAEALQEGCRGIRPFTLSIGGYSFFEKSRGADIGSSTSLLTVGGDLDELSVLHETLGSALADRGFHLEERRYIPHITLGRNVEHDELCRMELEGMDFSASMPVAKVTLFESQKIKGRMVYTPLHTVKL